MLTKKQYELLLFIERRLRESGVSPSFDEMKDALELKSKSGIHRLITALEERGFIRRLPHRARALEVLRFPENAHQHEAFAAAGVPPALTEGDEGGRVVRGNFGSAPRALPDDHVSLPLYGKIAAGTPIEALRHHGEMLSVPAAMAGLGKHYCLMVEGDSMIEAGILNGDVVIIRECQTAENGAIVVALVDGVEATLKRLRRKGNTVALEPANQTYETRIFGPDRVTVQGRLVGLMRTY